MTSSLFLTSSLNFLLIQLWQAQDNSCHTQRIFVSQIIIIWSWLHLLKKIVLNAYNMSDTGKKSASVSCINIWYKGIKLAQCFFGQNKKFFLLWKEFQSSLLSSLLVSSFVSSLKAFQSTHDLKLSFKTKKKNWIWKCSISSAMKKINLITEVLVLVIMQFHSF